MTRTIFFGVVRKGRTGTLAGGVAAARAVALYLLAAQPAGAAFPGQNGKIAFDRAFRIWEKRPVLTAPETKFRDDGASDSQAAFSPDGNAISRKAFSYDTATNRLSYTPATDLSCLRATKSWGFKVVR